MTKATAVRIEIGLIRRDPDIDVEPPQKSAWTLMPRSVAVVFEAPPAKQRMVTHDGGVGTAQLVPRSVPAGDKQTRAQALRRDSRLGEGPGAKSSSPNNNAGGGPEASSVRTSSIMAICGELLCHRAAISPREVSGLIARPLTEAPSSRVEPGRRRRR